MLCLLQPRVMFALRAKVARVIVQFQQLAYQRTELSGAYQGTPVFQLLAAVKWQQYLQVSDERFRRIDEMAIVLQQQRDTRSGCRIQQHTFAAVHRADQRGGQGEAPDLVALRFHKYRLFGIEALQCLHQRGVEPFLRRLCLQRQAAQHRAAMPGQGFEVEHLRAVRGECIEQAALAGTGGTADHAVAERGGQRVEFIQHLAPIGFVTAFQLVRRPAHLRQDDAHRTAALPAAPAIDQRPPGFWMGVEMRFDMVRDVLRYQCRADLARLERRHLLVQRADGDALLVRQYRAVDGAGDVVIGEFGRGAHVDDFVKLGEL